jgi:hypothetical protein
MSQPLSFKGRFQWWLYTTSHGQLLLRHNKSAEHPTRIDVLFKNVAMVQLATVFDDLEVTEAAVDAVPGLRGQLGALDLTERKIYLVRGVNCNGYIVAGSVTWNEDKGEYHEPSKLLP